MKQNFHRKKKILNNLFYKVDINLFLAFIFGFQINKYPKNPAPPLLSSPSQNSKRSHLEGTLIMSVSGRIFKTTIIGKIFEGTPSQINLSFEDGSQHTIYYFSRGWGGGTPSFKVAVHLFSPIMLGYFLGAYQRCLTWGKPHMKV